MQAFQGVRDMGTLVPLSVGQAAKTFGGDHGDLDAAEQALPVKDWGTSIAGVLKFSRSILSPSVNVVIRVASPWPSSRRAPLIKSRGLLDAEITTPSLAA